MLAKMLNYSIFVFHLLAIFLLSVSFQKDHLTFRCRSLKIYFQERHLK